MTRNICIVLAALAIPCRAWAKPEFPEQIRQHLALKSAPRCILCHDSDAGGGAVSQPFGQAMLAAGLTSDGGATLTVALDELDAERTDSNGDGVADIEGLRRGIAPILSKPSVKYGCGGARIAPIGAERWQAPAACLLVLAWLAGRSSLKRYFALAKVERVRARRVANTNASVGQHRQLETPRFQR